MMKSIITLCLLSASSLLFGQTKYMESKEDLVKHSELVATLFEEREIQAAFEEMKKYWNLPGNELESFKSTTESQLNMVRDRFGEIVDQQFYKEKGINDFYVLRIHILRFENHAIKLLMYYYKGSKGWTLNSFKWDDNLAELLD